MQAQTNALSSQAQLLEAICKRDAIQADLDSAAMDVSLKLLTLSWEGTPASELAGLLGLSRQRVYQLLRRAERDLHEQFDRREWEDARDRKAKREGRKSGWRNGTPQCYSCRKILSGYGAQCSCGGFSDPRGGKRYAA